MIDFEEHKKLVYLSIYKFYKTTDKSAINNIVRKYALDYDDIVQIAMIKLWKVAKLYDEEKGAFSTFAVNAILNEFKVIARQGRAWSRVINNSNMLWINDSVDTGKDKKITISEMLSTEEEAFNDLENRDYVLYLINQLQGQDKSIMLFYWYGMSQKEIGNMIGHSQRMVSHRMKEIKERFEGDTFVEKKKTRRKVGAVLQD